MHFTGPCKNFEQKIFLWKLLSSFYVFLTLSKSILTICWETFGGVVKLHSEFRCHSFCEKHFVCERSIFVLAVLNIERVCFAASLKTYLRHCDNCIQCVQKNIFTNDNFFEKQMTWYFLQTLSWMFWHFVERRWARLWKLLSLCP